MFGTAGCGGNVFIEGPVTISLSEASFHDAVCEWHVRTTDDRVLMFTIVKLAGTLNVTPAHFIYEIFLFSEGKFCSTFQKVLPESCVLTRICSSRYMTGPQLRSNLSSHLTFWPRRNRRRKSFIPPEQWRYFDSFVIRLNSTIFKSKFNR